MRSPSQWGKHYGAGQQASALIVVMGMALLAGCSNSEESAATPVVDAGPIGLQPLAPLAAAPLTSDQTIVATHAVLATPDSRSPSDPASLAAMVSEGYGATTIGPGQAYVVRTLDGQSAPAPGAQPKLLARFAHVTDVHVVDDESPSRLASYDGTGGLAGAFRPQDALQCHVLNAMVRTLEAVHRATPLSFVMLGGDLADNAQSNEVDWLLRVLDGSQDVTCDSGDPNLQDDGADVDPKETFASAGLSVPWYWSSGNHDVLRQGSWPITEAEITKAVGTDAKGGTRDWTQPGGPIFLGPVVPDPERRLLYPAELLARVAQDGDGHGLGQAQIDSGRAFYSFDLPDTPLRFVVLDLAAQTGSAEGLLRREDLDGFVRPALDQAVQDGRWVVLASHYAAQALTDGGSYGGTVQADAVLPAEWQEVLGTYPNVLLSLVGHAHVHQVTGLKPTAGHALWEVMTSALADWPSQARIIEIWDQDNGAVMIRATNVDYSTEGDAPGELARTLAAVDHVSGWAGGASGSADDDNVELWIAAP